MLETVKNTISAYNMLDAGEQVVAALSGGADSVSLVLALKSLGYKVKAVHVNHMLRGDESFRDENFCREFCEKNGVELFVERVDVRDFMEKSGLSLETAARELRYDALFKYESLGKIATAHTADDCLETALFNLSRGTGIKGLCGVPATRDNVIRPLVNVTREQVEQFLSEKNQPFVTDSTNLLADCSRNKIRLLVVPELKKVNGSALKNYIRSREILETDDDFLMKEGRKAFLEVKDGEGYDAEKLTAYHEAVKSRAAGEILKENGVSISREKISELLELCEKGGKINLKEDTFACCEKGVLRFESGEKDEIPFEKDLKIGETTDFFGRKVTLFLKNADEGNVNKNFTNHALDYDKIKGIIVLRNRRNGDKIRLVNRGFTSSLKKLMNASVPRENRGKTVLLADGEGLVFAEGFGCAERVRIDENTRRILEISVV